MGHNTRLLYVFTLPFFWSWRRRRRLQKRKKKRGEVECCVYLFLCLCASVRRKEETETLKKQRDPLFVVYLKRCTGGRKTRTEEMPF